MRKENKMIGRGEGGGGEKHPPALVFFVAASKRVLWGLSVRRRESRKVCCYGSGEGGRGRG